MGLAAILLWLAGCVSAPVSEDQASLTLVSSTGEDIVIGTPNGMTGNALGLESRTYRASLSITSDAPLSLGIGAAGNGADLARLGLQAGAYIDGALPEDLLVFATGTGDAAVAAALRSLEVGFSGVGSCYAVMPGAVNKPDGTAYPGSDSANTTCGNWVRYFPMNGKARVGHFDRSGNDPVTGASWNSAHDSAGCSQDELKSTGGDGLLYCFAAN